MRLALPSSVRRPDLRALPRLVLTAALGVGGLGVGGLAIGSLGGCSLGPDYHRPALDLPAAYRATTASAAAAWPAEDWWRGFDSPALTALIEQTRAHNFDIAAAAARVQQADAQVRIAGASLLPALSGSGSASWQHQGIGSSSASRTGSVAVGGSGSNRSFDFHSYQTGLSASYELDFWGRYRAARQAAVANAIYSRFDQQTVALTAVTDTANTWFLALSLADRLAVARRALADSEQTLAVIRGRFQAGTASALDVAQQEALTASIRAQIPSFTSQLDQTVIGLGILTGQPPERLAVRPDTLVRLHLPPVSPGLPSALLTRRPDIAAAEAQLIAANFNIQAARAAFFPSISLTGSTGYQAAALNKLIMPGAALAALTGSVNLPIFDGGVLRGDLEQAQGRYRELLAGYRKAVVQALTDVDTALTAWRYTSEQEGLQRQAVETARRAATIARAQMAAGAVDITTVLQAETTLFNDEDALVQVRLARAQALLSLYKALGGGWRLPADSAFPGLRPGMAAGGVALPVGGNLGGSEAP